MPWVESQSMTFSARHESADAACAERVLDALEERRLRLEDHFEFTPDEDLTVIIHPSPAWLAAAHPFLPAARLAAAPAGRRYLAGLAMASELHVLSDEHLMRRAAGRDSLTALLGTAERLYAQLVIGGENERLPPPWGPGRFLRYLRWSWLVEGGAQYFSGQTPLFRAAVSTRMRGSRRPSFPPSQRDAIILGGTIFDLLERRRGLDACHVLVSRLRRSGADSAIEIAFDQPASEVEAQWRRYLAEEIPRGGIERFA